MNWSPRTILIADEDREQARLLAEHLRGLGYAVQTAFDGVSALASYMFGDLDVACIGSSLIGVHGDAVCSTIIRDGIRGSIPLIVLDDRAEDDETEIPSDHRTRVVARGEDDWTRLENLLAELTGRENPELVAT